MAGVAVLAAALPLAAQTTPTGTVSGKVVDPQGLAMPGVTVTVSSPQLQGTRSQVTSENGDYILPFLPPGDYTVSFELSGFTTVKRETKVFIDETKAINVAMTVSGQTESVTVVAAAPEAFGTGATGAATVSQELSEKLPLNRTFQQAALLLPGVQDSGPAGNISISGAASFENLFMVNGVVIQDNIRNTPFNLFIEDALQETKATTSAVSAEYGRFSGGVVNAITKSGGNDFSGSFRTTFENDDWVSTTPFPGDSRLDKIVPTYEATLGGPIVRNKLWFFGAGRLRDLSEQRFTAVTRIPFQRDRDERRYEGKLTWSPGTNHTFKGSYTRIEFEERGNTFGTIMDLASVANRELPQRLYSFNYTGILTPRFFVEAQYSRRDFTFVGSGSQFTDLIRGTLLRDRSRGLNRYNSPTFCGVCDDEKRDNNNYVAKASYFLSTGGFGSHNIVLGTDVFDDKRFSNNHQSGSDFRIHTTSAILSPNGIFPVLNGDGTTIIRWTPIFESTQGNRFRTVSVFLNDAWTLDNHWSFNAGVRYDKNDGADSLGNQVVKDSAISPRLSASFDPKGDGELTFNAAYGRYVAALANAIGDSASAGGQPATIDFTYLGPSVNVDNPATPVPTDQALQTLFDWFFANGGTNRPVRGTPSVPGVTSQIGDRLKSPSVDEYALGFTKAFGNRGRFRVDGVYRKFQDFYSLRTDLTTGQNADQFGRVFDLGIIENTNVPKRRYKGLHFQASFRPTERFDLGGNYTLSRTYGTFDGETGTGGPSTAAVALFPEYFDLAWGSGAAGGGGGPEGALASDIRHKARGWVTYDVPVPAKLGRLGVSWLQIFNSSAPYGAVGTIDTSSIVTNPGYVDPPTDQEYFFTARDAFRLANTHRSDVALNYSLGLGGRRSELFVRFVMLNVFNRQEITNLTDIGCGAGLCINTTVQTANQTSALEFFNPFTTEPVEGVHWRRAQGAFGSNFGDALSRFAYQTPRTYNVSVGVRF